MNRNTENIMLNDAENTLSINLTHLMVKIEWYTEQEMQELTPIAFKLSRDVLSEKTPVESDHFLNRVDDNTIRLLCFFIIIQFCDDTVATLKDFYLTITIRIQPLLTNISFKEFRILQEEFAAFIMKDWAWSLNPDEMGEMHRKSFVPDSVSSRQTDASASPETDTSECLAVIKETDSGSDIYVSGDDEPGDTPPIMYFDGKGFFTPKYVSNKGLTTPTKNQELSLLFSP